MVPPFWYDYYYNNYYPNIKEKTTEENNVCQTPVPFWGYYPSPSPYSFMPQPQRSPPESDSETGRNTPLPPYWGYYPNFYAPTPNREIEEYFKNNQSNKEESVNCKQTAFQYPPPYWDPYYYYYGYPPMYSPYPFYEHTDSEEVAGYSSTDEMIYFGQKMKNEHVENKTETNLTSENTVILSNQNIKTAEQQPLYESEAETEPDTVIDADDKSQQQKYATGLQAIRSVKDINVYNNDEEETALTVKKKKK